MSQFGSLLFCVSFYLFHVAEYSLSHEFYFVNDYNSYNIILMLSWYAAGHTPPFKFTAQQIDVSSVA